MNKNTAELENEISKAESLEDFLDGNKENFFDFDLPKYLNFLLTEKNLSKPEIIKKSELDYVYAYHIFSGRKKKPSRNKIISLALAMKCSLEETQRLLYYANVEKLYVRNEWDSIIVFALEKHFTVKQTNELLNEFNFSNLIGEFSTKKADNES